MNASFDILVVGAGPAGCVAAHAAAQAGATVLMIEKRKHIGKPVQCAEFIPRLLSQKVRIPAEAVVQETRGMTTILPGGEAFRKNAPGFILDRGKFDRALAERAQNAGVRIMTRTRAVSRENGAVVVSGPGGQSRVSVSVVIGADGPRSTVGSWIGQVNKKFVWSVQHTVKLKRPALDTEVYFGRHYPGGYAWLFPKGETANVGVGIRREMGGRAGEALEFFKKNLGERIGEVVGVTSGFIPVGGPLAPVDEKQRAILVGDAAGHTHAITGGGIPQAVICGALAGSAGAAAAAGDQKAFADYALQCHRALGSGLKKAAEKRDVMEAGWSGGDLNTLLKKSWVACEEYYHDR